jgi:ABC-type glycerol-3-phosphate transport system substrate-binding protein
LDVRDDAAWNQQVNLAIASDDMPDVFCTAWATIP